MMREVSPLSEVMELLVKLEFAVERKDGRMNRGTGVVQQLLWDGILVLAALCCAGGYGLRVIVHIEVGRELGGLVADELCGGDLAYLDNIGVANELLLQTLTTVGLVAGCVPDAER